MGWAPATGALAQVSLGVVSGNGCSAAGNEKSDLQLVPGGVCDVSAASGPCRAAAASRRETAAGNAELPSHVTLQRSGEWGSRVQQPAWPTPNSMKRLHEGNARAPARPALHHALEAKAREPAELSSDTAFDRRPSHAPVDTPGPGTKGHTEGHAYPMYGDRPIAAPGFAKRDKPSGGQTVRARPPASASLSVGVPITTWVAFTVTARSCRARCTPGGPARQRS